MTQVIVTALYLWLAITAIALVIWAFRGLRRRRAAERASEAIAAESLASEKRADAAPTINLTDRTPTPIAQTENTLETVGASTGAPGAATMKASAIARAAQLAERREAEPVAKADPSPQPVTSDVAAPTVTAPVADGRPHVAPPKSIAAPAPTAAPGHNADAPVAHAPAVSPSAVPPAPAVSAPAATPPSVTPSPATPAQDTPTPPTPPARLEPPAVSLADLVRGIRLPHDLTPMVPDDDAVAAVGVTLVSAATPAGEVGASFADELERLGYEIFSTSETEAVAKRPASDSRGGSDGAEEIMSLAIRTDVSPQGSSTVGGTAVAIDLWVGEEASPLPER